MNWHRGMGDTTVTVAGQTITVDAEGNWVIPWYCYLIGMFDPVNCTAPSAAVLLAANNAANLGAAASPTSTTAASTAMATTDQAAMEADPCYNSESPTLCALTGGYIGGNGVGQPCLLGLIGSGCGSGTCVIGSSQANDDGTTCCALAGICGTTWLLITAAGVAGLVLLSAMKGRRRR